MKTRYYPDKTYVLPCAENGPAHNFEWQPRAITYTHPEFCSEHRAARRSKGLDALWAVIDADQEAQHGHVKKAEGKHGDR